MIRARCPDPHDWQALLEGRGGDTPAGLAGHLESCPDCRKELEALAADAAEWRDAAQALAQRPRTGQDPALRHVVERLKDELPAPAQDEDLSFLRPAGKPGLLGLLGPYEVQEVIGRGGMGVVLKAFEPALNRVVAIKVMAAALAGNATARRRFRREAQAAASVIHDHVVAVHGVSDIDGLPYLVMQYVAGESLQDRLDRNGPLPVAEVVRIGMQTASGLAAAHAQGLIHRDIKPANLLLENGVARVKITDFGLARTADDAGLTQAGVLAGTPEYMAPEQARGEAVDHRADLYGLGAVLYACCTGVPPFRGASAVAVLRRVNDEEPAPIRSRNADVPAWLEALIGRLMAKDPVERFPSAAEVAALLEGYLGHLRQPAAVPPPKLPPPPPGASARSPRRRTLRRFGLPLGLAALALAAGLALGVALGLPGAGTGPGAKAEDFQEFSCSFRGNRVLDPGLELYGEDSEQCVRFEPEGLRITMPAGHPGEHRDTGVSTSFGARGDFEITAGFEIVKECQPAEAGSPGTRLSLSVAVADQPPELKLATLSRMVSRKELAHFGAWETLGQDRSGKMQQSYKAVPTRATTGRLRLVRTGPRLDYYAAETADGNLTLLASFPFTAEDVKFFTVASFTGGPGAWLDARVTDLRVRAQSLPGAPDSAAVPPATAGNRGSLAAILACLVAVTVVALAIRVWLWLRRGRRGAKKLAPARPPAALPPLSFRCPGCAKPLRAGAGLAGKEVKCPGCGQAVLVPAAGAADVGRAPAS